MKNEVDNRQLTAEALSTLSRALRSWARGIISDEDNLVVDYQMDSLDTVELAMELEERFGFSQDLTKHPKFSEVTTVRTLKEFLLVCLREKVPLYNQSIYLTST